jgi:hypothetical protein
MLGVEDRYALEYNNAFGGNVSLKAMSLKPMPLKENGLKQN